MKEKIRVRERAISLNRLWFSLICSRNSSIQWTWICTNFSGFSLLLRYGINPVYPFYFRSLNPKPFIKPTVNYYCLKKNLNVTYIIWSRLYDFKLFIDFWTTSFFFFFFKNVICFYSMFLYSNCLMVLLLPCFDKEENRLAVASHSNF